jgi:hypothetical protein
MVLRTPGEGDLCPPRDSNLSPGEQDINGLGDFRRKPSKTSRLSLRSRPAQSGSLALRDGHLTATNVWCAREASRRSEPGRHLHHPGALAAQVAARAVRLLPPRTGPMADWDAREVVPNACKGPPGRHEDGSGVEMRVGSTASECPRRDSNPCYRLERPASWASRRRGPTSPTMSRGGIEPPTLGLKGRCSTS